MDKSDPRYLLKIIAKILDDLSIDYVVTGGIAVLIWGRPRYTADIDIVVELASGSISKLAQTLRELGKAGYINEDAMKDALKHKGEFNFIDGNSGLKVDFWIAKGDEFDKLRLSRKVKKEILDYTVNFSSAEDLILIKLFWGQDAISTRHTEDIVSILDISGDKLDFDYINKWAVKLGVDAEWQKIFEKKS